MNGSSLLEWNLPTRTRIRSRGPQEAAGTGLIANSGIEEERARAEATAEGRGGSAGVGASSETLVRTWHQIFYFYLKSPELYLLVRHLTVLYLLQHPVSCNACDTGADRDEYFCTAVPMVGESIAGL